MSQRTTENQTLPPKPMTGSGTMRGYRVEARCYAHNPQPYGDMILDKEWRQIPFREGAPGVPTGPYFNSWELQKANCYDYAAAEALRWWFHAELAHGFRDLCVESRIVEYKIEWSFSTTRLAEYKQVGGEDRSTMMPDWGFRS